MIDFKSLSDEHKLKLKDWLDHVITEPMRQKVLHLLESSEEEVHRMTANITRTLQEEKEQAVEMGKRAGEIKGKIEVAKKLFNMGLEIERIIEATGLTKEEIESI